jgi:3-oxoacyl-[acyl-carrier protein] reductase
MDLGIRGRTAAVAAASTGLGYGSAAALVAEGVKVAICSRDRARVEAAAERLGADVVPIVADVGTEEGAASFVDQAVAALGPIDILVPNAGGPPRGAPSETTTQAYRDALALNALSTIVMCQRALPAMRERHWGRIVAITSAGARSPIPMLAASSTARAAVTSFLKVLATEVAKDGVTVNSVQPGVHATDRIKGMGPIEEIAKRIPAGIVGTADDFGAIVAFLCSEQAKFVTGTSVLVDGGSFSGLI